VSVAREGWPVIATAAGVLGVVGVVGTLAGHPLSLVPLVVGVGFVLWFFRDPERIAPGDERSVVSPADGRVLAVVPEREERFLGGPATRVSIFMSPLDVHVNRTPVSGVVSSVQHTAGKFRAAFSDKSSLDNERNAVVVEAGGRRYLMIQIAGALARRIVCHVGPGDRVQRGERFGMIMFGSRVDFFLPPGVEPVVKPGDRVHAGSTVVAEVRA
jgi:phosphatidylserine decarboxylase